MLLWMFVLSRKQLNAVNMNGWDEYFALDCSLMNGLACRGDLFMVLAPNIEDGSKHDTIRHDE